MSSCSVAPGSPVFSPSRLLKTADLPASTFLPASPLRPALSLRVRHRPDPTPSPAAPASTSTVLKRRRPAPLLIVPAAVTTAPPEAVLHGMDEVTEQGEGFAAYCRRGKGRRRVEMEDRHVAKVALGGDPKVALFAVFDGHGGKDAAEFAAENMPKFMADEMKKVDAGDWGDIEEAVKRGYLKTDEEFLKREESGGACCVTALLQEGDLVVSNTGDCRAVLSRGGKAEVLTSDHRASREDERERIENSGGFVVNYRGTWRVQGSLAVSRGIGDAHLKQWVVANPDTRTLLVDPHCEFLILASDGLWDKVDNQEAIDIARPLCINNDKASHMAACRRLVETTVSRGSTDDTSVVIIQLQKFSASS